MNLSQLEVFIAIVETGSLKEAAETIGLTHSAVSYSLSKLEAELGVTLLERGRQGITITRIGDEVLQHARNIMDEVEIVRQITARERGIHMGKIRFACIPHVPPRLLTGIIRNFQHHYPDIQVVVLQGESQDILQWLESGIADVGTLMDSSLYSHAIPLIESPIYVLMSDHHRFAMQATITIADVLSEPIIGSKTEIEAFTQMLPVWVTAHADFRYQISERNTIYTMVAEGFGISILPKVLIDIESKGIIARPIEPATTIQAYIAARVKSPANQAFLRVAQDWTRSHGMLTNDT